MTRYLLLMVCVFAISCSQQKSSNTSEADFYYYPEKNVYFSLSSQYYYYSLNGGKTWDSLLLENENEPATLGEKIIVQPSSKQVWLENSKHLKAYNGSLLNILSPDSNYIAPTTEVVLERKSARKSSGFKASKKQGEQPKAGKKGVKDFFKNIFGKKKKADD